MQPSASCPAALSSARLTVLRAVPCCSPHVVPYCPTPQATRSADPRVAPCCPARRALLQPARRTLLLRASCPTAARALRSAAPRPAATTTAAAAAARATAAAAARATAATGGGAAGSAGGVAGAGGAGGMAGSTRGAAAAGGAGPTTDTLCLSWPLSWQLQRPGVDSSGQCLSRMTPPLSSFMSGVEAAAPGSCESAAALGAGESAAALGACESADALGASASTATGPASAEALHTFTLDSGASRCFFRDCTTVTSLAAPVPPGSGLYTVTTASTQVAESGQVAASSRVSASGQLVASCSCRVLSHQTLFWHHRLGHPSLPRLCSMHSCLLRAAPHSSEFPPTTAPLQTLHMDVWGPAPVGGTDRERYFLLVVDDYTRYTIVLPLRRKADVSGVLIPWIRATRHHLRERFRWDFPVPRLHSDRGGEFSSDLLAEFCRDEGICQSFTLPASPQQNGIVEHRIGLIMELNLWPRVSEPETSPTFWWTGKVADATVFRVWGALSLVRDAKASKLSSRTLCCVFLGFPTDAPPWQFYHPRAHRFFSSQHVTFDETVCFYRLHLHASHPPLEISSDSSGLAEGGDPAANNTLVAKDYGAETAGAKPGGAETEGEGSGGAATRGAGSGGAATGGADSGGAASPSSSGAVGDPAGGPRAGQPLRPDLLVTLSLLTGIDSSRPFTVGVLLDMLRRAARDRCGVAVDQGARQLQLTGLGDGWAVDQEGQFDREIDGAVR
ncbi:unnamed protein product [Closterium sp. NIES-53]